MIRKISKGASVSARKAGAFALAAIVACSLSFPQLAFAAVRVDQTELAQGENSVGGGKATLADSSLEMSDVKADELYTDEDLSINFNGGNDIEEVRVAESANVDMSFKGENDVEDITASGNSNVTINADGHDDIEEVYATDDANVTINVTGKNEFERIGATDNANITIQGTDCQKKDVVNLAEDNDGTYLTTEKGDLTIDHATVNVKGKSVTVGSEQGNVSINTSKVAQGDGNEYTVIKAGGTMKIDESVIDITGTVQSNGKMTIKHSDVKAKKPSAKYGDTSLHRIWSKTGIELIEETNGKVEKGEVNGDAAFVVNTGDGKDADLKADGDPAYKHCAGERPSQLRAMPGTGDDANPLFPMAAGVLSAATAAFAVKRREDQQS